MKAKRGLRRLLSLIIVLCLVLGMGALSVMAAGNDITGNDTVTQDKTGVLQVNLWVRDKETNNLVFVHSGSGFLINEKNLVTCYHVTHFSEEEYKSIEERLGLSRKQIDERAVRNVTVYRDNYDDATIEQELETADISVLSLKDALQNRNSLILNTGDVRETAPCYSLGFPDILSIGEDARIYTSEDVTVAANTINKMITWKNVKYVVHNAKISNGSSGGPLVNYQGHVIGINNATVSADGGGGDYNYSIDVRELIALLEPYGIPFEKSNDTPSPAPVPDPDPITTTEQSIEETVDKSQLENALTASNIETENYEESYVKAFTDAKAEAERISADSNASQEQVDKVKQDLVKAQTDMQDHPAKSGLGGLPLPAIIAIIVAAIILIVVIILLRPGKKAAEPVYSAPDPYAAGGGFGAGPGPVAPGYGGAPAGFDYGGKPESGTTVLGGGAGDTTVLGGDSNSTTVLSGGANYGSLTRTKTGEHVTITKDQFKIGRERSRVDFCISDNTAVGRLHAIIVSRGGSTYVVDQNSTNCTFVNSVRATANQEVRLNNGDKVTFADEEFTYNAF